MNCSSCKNVWIQAGAIVALGTAIGLADAFHFRPITLGREAPPRLDLTKPQGDAAKPPVPTPTSTPAPTPTTPAPAAPAPNPSAGGAFEFTPKDKLPAGHITVDDAKALYDQGATFIDSRKSDVYQAGHVTNAFRIELAMFTGGNPPMLAMVPQDAFVVVYCSGGHCDESERVAEQLSGSGYKKVYIMHDGFPGWKAKGFPVETGKGMDQ